MAEGSVVHSGYQLIDAGGAGLDVGEAHGVVGAAAGHRRLGTAQGGLLEVPAREADGAAAGMAELLVLAGVGVGKAGRTHLGGRHGQGQHRGEQGVAVQGERARHQGAPRGEAHPDVVEPGLEHKGGRGLAVGGQGGEGHADGDALRPAWL